MSACPGRPTGQLLRGRSRQGPRREPVDRSDRPTAARPARGSRRTGADVPLASLAQPAAVPPTSAPATPSTNGGTSAARRSERPLVADLPRLAGPSRRNTGQHLRHSSPPINALTGDAALRQFAAEARAAPYRQASGHDAADVTTYRIISRRVWAAQIHPCRPAASHRSHRQCSKRKPTPREAATSRRRKRAPDHGRAVVHTAAGGGMVGVGLPVGVAGRPIAVGAVDCWMSTAGSWGQRLWRMAVRTRASAVPVLWSG
jgi:hypothetical protein